jgi:hypothetical protein
MSAAPASSHRMRPAAVERVLARRAGGAMGAARMAIVAGRRQAQALALIRDARSRALAARRHQLQIALDMAEEAARVEEEAAAAERELEGWRAARVGRRKRAERQMWWEWGLVPPDSLREWIVMPWLAGGVPCLLRVHGERAEVVEREGRRFPLPEPLRASLGARGGRFEWAGGSGECICSCLWLPSSSALVLVDVLRWRGLWMLEHPAQFRFEWGRSQLADAEIGEWRPGGGESVGWLPAWPAARAGILQAAEWSAQAQKAGPSGRVDLMFVHQGSIVVPGSTPLWQRWSGLCRGDEAPFSEASTFDPPPLPHRVILQVHEVSSRAPLVALVSSEDIVVPDVDLGEFAAEAALVPGDLVEVEFDEIICDDSPDTPPADTASSSSSSSSPFRVHLAGARIRRRAPLSRFLPEPLTRILQRAYNPIHFAHLLLAAPPDLPAPRPPPPPSAVEHHPLHHFPAAAPPPSSSSSRSDLGVADLLAALRLESDASSSASASASSGGGRPRQLHPP